MRDLHTHRHDTYLTDKHLVVLLYLSQLLSPDIHMHLHLLWKLILLSINTQNLLCPRYIKRNKKIVLYEHVKKSVLLTFVEWVKSHHNVGWRPLNVFVSCHVRHKLSFSQRQGRLCFPLCSQDSLKSRQLPRWQLQENNNIINIVPSALTVEFHIPSVCVMQSLATPSNMFDL